MWRDVGDLITWAGGVIGGLSAIGVGLRLIVVRPLRKWLSAQIETPLGEMREEVTKIKGEVTANSGHSLKDRVVQTCNEVQTLHQRFDDHLQNHRGG